MDTRRNLLKKKRRVVIKIGSSSLQHTETGDMDYIRLEVLVRELCNLKNQGKDVVLVSSGAIAQGKKAVHLTPEQLQEHRSCCLQPDADQQRSCCRRRRIRSRERRRGKHLT